MMLVTPDLLSGQRRHSDRSASCTTVLRSLSCKMDTSPYTLEERILCSTWTHERPISGDSIKTIRDRFSARFHKEAPLKAALLKWERKLFLTGNIKDAPRSGRPKTRIEQCAAVEQSIADSPLKSTRKRSSELGIPRTTMRRHMKEDLDMRCWRPQFVNELTDDDRDKRVACCNALLDTFITIPSRGKVFFTDECAIYRSSRTRNVFFWSKENPHFVEEVEHHPPHVMMWAAVSSRYCLGPYFFLGVCKSSNIPGYVAELVSS